MSKWEVLYQMRIEDKPTLGILSSFIIGFLVLLAGVLFSVVDKPTLQEDALADFGAGWQVEVAGQTYENVQFPTHIAPVSVDSTMVLTNSLPSTVDRHMYVFFRASHQKVRVYIQNQLVYSFGWGEQHLFSKTPGCAWIMVPLTDAAKFAPIRVELTGVYTRYANRINAFYIGDKGAIFGDIVHHRLVSMFICFVLLILGIGMIGVSAALRNRKATASLRRLGLFTCSIAVWSACVANFLQLLYPNVLFWLHLEFFTFNLLLPTLLLFLLSFPYYQKRRWMHVFFWVSLAQFMLIEVLQLTNIADYMESILLTHIVLAVTLGTVIGTGIYALFRKHVVHEEVKVLVFSVVVLLLFTSLDLVRFYHFVPDEGLFTRLGTLILIGIWMFAVVHAMSRRFADIAKTEALEVLAYVDLMTGLRNRTAFEEWLQDYASDDTPQDSYIVTFDMNGLKQINDQMGHMKGDQAIIAIARIIKEVFEPKGVCYRVGGDEICVILPKADGVEAAFLQASLQQVESMVAASSQALHVDFSVAVGYALTSSKNDVDFYQAYKEADHRMYAHKQQMKSS